MLAQTAAARLHWAENPRSSRAPPSRSKPINMPATWWWTEGSTDLPAASKEFARMLKLQVFCRSTPSQLHFIDLNGCYITYIYPPRSIHLHRHAYVYTPTSHLDVRMVVMMMMRKRRRRTESEDIAMTITTMMLMLLMMMRM